MNPHRVVVVAARRAVAHVQRTATYTVDDGSGGWLTRHDDGGSNDDSEQRYEEAEQR